MAIFPLTPSAPPALPSLDELDGFLGLSADGIPPDDDFSEADFMTGNAGFDLDEIHEPEVLAA
jgi:hypothetical protein